MGVRFAKVTSLPELLQMAMYQSGNPEAAAAMVDAILDKKKPVPPASVKAKQDPVRLLLAGVAAAALLLLGTLVLVLLQGR